MSMLKKLTVSTMMIAIGLCTVGTPTAEAAKVDRRQVRQQVRITQGVQNGSLTRRETKTLRRQQRHIRRTERRAKADGVVTVKEQRALNRKQNRASRSIARKKRS